MKTTRLLRRVAAKPPVFGGDGIERYGPGHSTVGSAPWLV
jgi:hypothetical protein